MSVQILTGDCTASLRSLPDESVHCVVTSPPYFGLRDYGVAGQIGVEDSPQAFVAALVAVFAEVRRVLRDDGTLWLNLGDSYCPENRGENAKPRSFEGYAPQLQGNHFHADVPTRRSMIQAVKADGIKRKDLIGIPWRVAFALQADGWYLRQDIIWSKPNPMPESVRDRCTKAHEYIFLLAKSEKYYFDSEAMQEPFAESTLPRAGRAQKSLARIDGVPGQPPHSLRQPRSYRGSTFTNGKTGAIKPTVGQGERIEAAGRNKRSVWTVTTKPFKGAHFATFPPDLIEPCVLAGCPEGGTVLDPFGGAGTTGLVAQRHRRNAVLCELNPEYAAMARARIDAESPLKDLL